MGSLPFPELFLKRENLGRSGDAKRRKQGGGGDLTMCHPTLENHCTCQGLYNYKISCRNLAVLLCVNGSSEFNRATKHFLSSNWLQAMGDQGVEDHDVCFYLLCILLVLTIVTRKQSFGLHWKPHTANQAFLFRHIEFISWAWSSWEQDYYRWNETKWNKTGNKCQFRELGYYYLHWMKL